MLIFFDPDFLPSHPEVDKCAVHQKNWSVTYIYMIVNFYFYSNHNHLLIFHLNKNVMVEICIAVWRSVGKIIGDKTITQIRCGIFGDRHSVISSLIRWYAI